MSAEKNLVNKEDLVHLLEAFIKLSSFCHFISQFFGIGFHDALRETTVFSPPPGSVSC